MSFETELDFLNSGSFLISVAALETKLTLAAQQKLLQAEIGVQYSEFSPADVKRYVLDTVQRRLENRQSMGLADWSCRVAGEGGNLQ